MATRNIVPRATGEGQIGTSAKTWSAVYANDIAVTNGVSASTFTGDLTGDVTGDVTGNVTGDVTGDVTGTASGNLALTGGTMTGAITTPATGDVIQFGTGGESLDIQASGGGKTLYLSMNTTGTWPIDGAQLVLHDGQSQDGSFQLNAGDDNGNYATLKGYPNGNLTWNGINLNYAVDYSMYKTASSFTTPSIVQSRIKDLGGGYKKVGNIVYVYVRFRMNTTLTKGGWGVLNGFPAPYNMGFSNDYRIPLIATAWYGDPYSGNVSSAFMDTDGTMRLITNGQMESTNTSNYYIYVYGNYYTE